MMITIQIKRLLAEPPTSSSSIIKDFVPSPQTSFVPTLLVFIISQLGQRYSQKSSPICLLHRELTTGHGPRNDILHYLPTKQKNNKQEELATRSGKHRPQSQLCLWSFAFLFNTDVVLFLAYDLCAIPCRRWRSEDHCCRVCSLDMKKETVNEWNKMSTPFRFFKNKSKQARYWILLGFTCVRELN